MCDSSDKQTGDEEEAGYSFVRKWINRKYNDLGLTVCFNDLNDAFRYRFGKRATGLRNALLESVDTGLLERPKGTGRSQVFSVAGAPEVVTAASWIITQAGVGVAADVKKQTTHHSDGDHGNMDTMGNAKLDIASKEPDKNAMCLGAKKKTTSKKRRTIEADFSSKGDDMENNATIQKNDNKHDKKSRKLHKLAPSTTEHSPPKKKRRLDITRSTNSDSFNSKKEISPQNGKKSTDKVGNKLHDKAKKVQSELKDKSTKSKQRNDSAGATSDGDSASASARDTKRAADNIRTEKGAKKTIVWAKVMSYPWWPARIADPRKEEVPTVLLSHESKTKHSRLVQFYGTLDYLWVPRSGIRDFRVNYKQFSKSIPSEHAADLEPAIEDAYDEYVEKYGTIFEDTDTICETCNSPDDADRMLLCDKCDSGFHIYCLTPPMAEKDIPTTNWYCDNCINAETDIDARGFVSSTNIAPGVVGLLNLGSTCYINSFIQCLNSAVHFRKAFLHNMPPIELSTAANKAQRRRGSAGSDGDDDVDDGGATDEDELEQPKEKVFPETSTNVSHNVSSTNSQPIIIGKRLDFVLALQAVFHSIWQGGGVDRSLLHSLRLASGQALDFKYFRNEHQDINEFFMQALEYIHNNHNHTAISTNVAPSHSSTAPGKGAKANISWYQDQALDRWRKHVAANSSVVSEMFEGMITRTRTCPRSHISTSYEIFRILPLQFPTNPKIKYSRRTNSGGGSILLADMLDHFSQEEKLRCRCEECGGQDNKSFTQKTEIFKFPPFLVIQLARFAGIVAGEGDDAQWWSNKITTEVVFPITTLDFRQRFPNANPYDPPPIYDLIAVANHKGGVTGGHYYTFVKSPDSGTKMNSLWYNFNDNIVKEIKDKQLVSEFAYMLIYERRKK